MCCSPSPTATMQTRSLLLLASLAAALGAAAAQAPVRELPPFSRVQLCVPFNVLVSPSTRPPAYGIQVEADPAVAAALTAAVSGGTLQLESGGFSTPSPIQVQGGVQGELLRWHALPPLPPRRCMPRHDSRPVLPSPVSAFCLRWLSTCRPTVSRP